MALAVFLALATGAVPAWAVPSATTSSTTTTVPALNPRGEPPPPAVPQPFGRLHCGPSDGVRFCPGGDAAGHDVRVPSFDGVPLDVDVTLPAAGRGPFPLVVLLHGLGGTKVSFESSVDDGGVDNVTLASRGFAVVNYTARGFGESCGTPQSRTPACARGWTHLADQRYEIRDTEYLAGLLVDEGLVLPTFGTAGNSYGGGQSLELAMLHDRVRLLDGQLVPLVSPHHHIPMTVGAVYAMWPWQDLVTSLVPNGNPNDTMGFATSAATAATDTASDRHPVGLAKQSWLLGLYSLMTKGYLPPPGAEADDDLTTWFHALAAGDTSASVVAALRDLALDHSAAGIPPAASGPAATAIQSGWTDSLFPVSEALRYDSQFGNALGGGSAPLLQIFDDVGHSWAQNKPADEATNDRLGLAFLQGVLDSKGTPPSGVVTVGVTCPSSAPSDPVVPGHFFSNLDSGSVTVPGGAAQVVTSSGTPGPLAAMDPLSLIGLCQTRPAGHTPGTASYRAPVGSEPLFVLGSAEITATLRLRGRSPGLVAELWDVSPNGGRRFVALGAFRPAGLRPGATQQVQFALDPTSYTFAAGHAMEIDLVGSDGPTFAAPRAPFQVTVSGFQATVPTASVPTVTPLTF